MTYDSRYPRGRYREIDFVMKKITEKNINLTQIADSGQCFRMKKIDDGDGQAPKRAAGSGEKEGPDAAGSHVTYEIIARSRRVIATQEKDGITLDCDDPEDVAFWKKYFDVDTDTDYACVQSLADPKDAYLTAAVRAGSGIRILRQDLWEMLVTFLISQQNNIPRIHKCIDKVCREYGEQFPHHYGFPAPESMADLRDDELMPCNLGYRSKYVVRAARAVAGGELDLDGISAMDYREAREALLQVYGVGAKVADCICLFGLHHLNAFPVDTHVRQVLDREYGGDFPFDRYEGYAGVIQQYIFYKELLDGR